MRLRVLSYNIHKCIGGVDRRYEPSRVVDVIRKLDADVADAAGGRRRRRRARTTTSQVDLLGDELGMPHRTWFPNVEVRGGGQYGNAILSRYPIIESANIDLTLRFKKPRSVLHGVIRVRHDDVDRTVHVFNMHLGLARLRAPHPARRSSSTATRSRTSTTTRRSSSAATSTTSTAASASCSRPSGFRGIERRPLTFPAWGPVRALDAIFVRGDVDFLRLARCDSELARRASDHRPLVADVRLRPHRHHAASAHESKPPTPRP